MTVNPNLVSLVYQPHTRSEQIMSEMCERRIPMIVNSEPNGKFITAFERPCGNPATVEQTVTPVHPGELTFEVSVCDKHRDEALVREPVDEDLYVYCGECKTWCDRATGYCGCF